MVAKNWGGKCLLCLYASYAPAFGLLDWAEALLLEFQVAMKDFCTALYFFTLKKGQEKVWARILG